MRLLLFSPKKCYRSGRFHFSSFISFSNISCFHTEPFPKYDDEKPKLYSGSRNINQLNHALIYFNDMVRMNPLPCVDEFNKILSSTMKLKEYSLVISLFKDICFLGIPLTEYTLSIAINSYCNSNKLDYGFSVLSWVFKGGYELDSALLSPLLKGLFKENRVSEAQKLFSMIERESFCRGKLVLYGVMIDGLFKAGNISKAFEIFRRIERKNHIPTAFIYNVVINGLGKHHHTFVKYAVMIFFEMLKKDIVPDDVTYNSLIHELCEEGLPCKAEYLLVRMKENNLNPNLMIYSELMNGYCLENQVEEARHIFDSITPNIFSYNILINGYCKANKIDEALNLLFQMSIHGLKPDFRTYSTILQGLYCSGRCSTAAEFIEEMKDLGIEPDSFIYCNMLDGLFKNGLLDEAMQLLGELEQKGLDSNIYYYNVAINGMCIAEKLGIALELFNCLPSKGLEPNVVTYTTMITGFCRGGFLEKAQDFLMEMKKKNCLPDTVTYYVIVKGFLMEDDFDTAETFLMESVEKGYFPDVLTKMI